MSFTEVFVLLVIRHKVMSMAEFYEADVFDIDLVLSNLSEVDRDACERMRNIMWAMLAPNSKNQLKPEEIVTFTWEKCTEDAVVTTKEMYEEMCKKFNLKKL